MKFKSPTGEIVYAFQWTGGHEQQDDPVWLGKAIANGDVRFNNPGMWHVSLRIRTSDGIFDAQKYDYIICNKEGEIYPCARHIFEKIYEKVGA